ncbi:MAG: crossover junction endodeoxyribonuclease RuvC [Planctomycetes bacterium]|nr:crossover junction endodeoxyribonuclease RuvC [Planctomycetota bacterium]
MRILGIDPGLNTTGYAVLDTVQSGAQIVEAGVIRSSTTREKPELAKRLSALYDGLTEIVEQLKPEVLVVEQLYSHYAHPRTAILMGHARGVIFLAGAQKNLPVLSYGATRIKKTITGAGRASKEQMQLAILREFRLPKMPEPHDVADALAVALCHYHTTRRTAEEIR